MRSRILRLLLTGAFGYLGLHLMLAFLQRQIIYPASQAPEPILLSRATQLGLEPWRDGDGAIVGWKRPPHASAPPANRLVVFHGNAGFALHREHYIEGFASLADGRLWDVHLFEYPGYGARPGKPGEREITRAAIAALDVLAAQDSRPIYLLGESIGTGPACALARDRPQSVAGLFLVTPFSSLGEVAAYHYRFLSVRLFLRDRWDNAAALRDYRGSLATMLAGEDEVIPARFGRHLYDGFAGPKRLWLQADATHNTLDLSPTTPWWREVSDFLLGEPSPLPRKRSE